MKGLFKNSLLVASITKSWKILSLHHRRRALWISFLLGVNTVLEIIGLAALIPIISLLLQENIFEENERIQGIYDYMGFTSETSFILFICVLLLLIFIVKNIASLLITYKKARFAFSLYRYFATRLQYYFYEKGMAFLKTQNSNELVRDINKNSNWFSKFIVLPTLELLNECAVFLLIVVGILLYSPQTIFILLLTVFPVFTFFFLFTRRRIKRYGLAINDLGASINRTLYQSIFGFVDVEINNTRHWFLKEYEQRTQELMDLDTVLHVFKQAPRKIIEIALMFALVLIIAFGLYFFSSRSEVGILIGIFGVAAYRIVPSVNRIMLGLISLRTYQFTIDKMLLVKDLELKALTESQEKITYNHTIQLDQLYFKYDEGPWILENINLEISKGEHIGIIGKSGSGKTTLVNILLRFLLEQKGEITIDGVKLEKSNLKQWRNIVGYVQQDVFLVDGTLLENIVFGIPEDQIDYKWVDKVIELSSLTALVEGLPEGINSKVGERGSQISGGQRQRIGIARALYSGAEVLFFDEATSALDNETELEITEAIQRLSENNLTIIIIAHRHSTLKYCDRIIELKKGKVFKELHYQDLV